MLSIFERRLRIVPDGAAQPSVTYVDRAHLNIERTLEQAIDVPNQIVSLAAGCKWIMACSRAPGSAGGGGGQKQPRPLALRLEKAITACHLD
jgi:hypothetical protein